VKSSESLLAEDSTVSSADAGLSLDEHLFDLIAEHGHEQISFASDRKSGYRGIIAVHNTILGPALGGTRFWDYRTDAEAFIDVLRLSRGMTYKAAVAGLNLGGGKSVILGDYRTEDREGIMRAHGRHVESLQGRYITAEDVGTSTSDMDFVRQETTRVVGLAGRSGDPSPVTALGTYRGMQACAKFHYGDESVAGKTVAVQGCGHVGYYLLKHLHEAGSKLVVSDIAPRDLRG
jgi:leucine dehydrogenase